MSVDKMGGAGSPEKEPIGIKEKLANLEQYMPGQEEVVYEFSRFLATRVSDALLTEGFNLAAEMALADLQKGKDDFNRKPIENRLVKNPPIIYTLLRARLPQIKEIVFVKDIK